MLMHHSTISLKVLKKILWTRKNFIKRKFFLKRRKKPKQSWDRKNWVWINFEAAAINLITSSLSPEIRGLVSDQRISNGWLHLRRKHLETNHPRKQMELSFRDRYFFVFRETVVTVFVSASMVSCLIVFLANRFSRLIFFSLNFVNFNYTRAAISSLSLSFIAIVKVHVSGHIGKTSSYLNTLA